MKLGRQTRKLNYVMLFAIFFLQVIDNYLREKKITSGWINNWKNILLLLVVLVLFYEINNLKQSRKEYKRLFYEETKYVVLLIISYLILSAYYMIKNSGIEIVTFTGLFKILVPAVVAYSILNLFELDDIYKLMSVLFVITFIGYLMSIAHLISISNFLLIDFGLSRSPFESTYFSPTAMGFCLFFGYYREKKELTIFSAFFAIMTFKRIMVLYAFFLLVFGGVVRNWGKVSKTIIRVFMVSFTIVSYLYILLMEGYVEDFIQRYLNMDVNQFSMGRSYFMKQFLTNFESHGFMTSTTYARSMEMDIPMIYVEMGFLAVIFTTYFITKIAKDNWYNFIIIVFCLFELLTSHWFDITYFWIVAYITIGCIAYKEDVLYGKKGRSIRIKVNL